MNWLKRLWARFNGSHAGKLGWVLLPVFVVAVWFAIETMLSGTPEAADGVKTNLLNAGTFSVRVFAAIFFVHLVTHPRVWGWDLANTFRDECQRILTGKAQGSAIGAFAVLAGEMVAKMWLLSVLLRSLVLWPQGAA